MKKFFTLILLCVATVISAAAAPITITLNCPFDDAATVTVGSYGDPMALKAGPNEVTFTPDAYWGTKITVQGTFDYKLLSVNATEAGEYSDFSVSGNTASKNFYYESADGEVYDVELKNVADSRTATATVDIIGSTENVQLKIDGNTIALQSGLNTIKFDPDGESEFEFMCKRYESFYTCTLNGVPVTPSGYYNQFYYITVADGDLIVIEPEYPDMDVDVIFNQTVAGLLRSVYIGFDQIYGYQNGDAAELTLTVKAGSTLKGYINMTDFKLGSVKVDGKEVSVSTYGQNFEFKVGVEPVVVEVVGEKYKDINFTVNVNDADHVGVYNGYSSYSGEYTLVDGANHLTMSEKSNRLYIEAKGGYYIASITDGEGQPIELNAGQLTDIPDGYVINIDVKEIEYDSKFAVFFNGVPSDYSYIYIGSDRQYLNSDCGYYVAPNYWVFKFASAAKPDFTLTLDADPYYNYINDLWFYEETELVKMTTYMSSQVIKPENGTIYYGFVGTEEPELTLVTVNAAAGAEGKFTFTQDYVKPVTDFTEGVQAFVGTTLTVATDDEGVTVYVDDQVADADANGVYTLTVTADMRIDIECDTQGVQNVDAAAAAPGAVYNLQGIRLDGDFDTLPAGFYIVDGKKVRK